MINEVVLGIAGKNPGMQTNTIDINDLAEINKMLSEININEGDAALQRGDKSDALRCYREAHQYAPNNIELYLKLADLLCEKISAEAEVKQLLLKGMRIAPESVELRDKFDELCRPLNQRKPAKLTSIKLTPIKLTPIKLKTAKITKSRSRGLLNNSNDEPQLPRHIRPFSLMMIVGIFSLALAIPIWSHFSSRIEIRPMETSSAFNSERMEFNWSTSTNDVNYLFQIEEHGEKLLERYTREHSYTLSQADLNLLKPEHRYQWRVMAVSAQKALLPCSTIEAEFRFDK